MRRLARVLPLALLAACHHPKSGKLDVDEPDLPGLPPVTDAGATTAPTAGAVDDWKPPAPVAAVGSADVGHAFVADLHGLVEIAPGPQVASATVTAGPIDWCNVDARGQVVWFARDGHLYAFDLVDRSVHRIVRNLGSSTPPVIDWGNDQLGGESKVDYEVALAVVMSATPRLDASIGCEGDRAYYCYDDIATEKPALKPELAAEVAAARALAISDPAYLAAVAARGANRSLWTPPPVPPPQPKRRPRVDRSACTEDESACGALSAIPGSPLWSVVTGNSRGDFYYESSALWDPATGEFVSAAGGTLTRERTAPTNSDLSGMRVSSTGVLSLDGSVFDGRGVYYAPKTDPAHTALSCGWTDGGWRMPGPRGG